MRFDLNKALKDVKGNPALQDNKEVTYADASIECLMIVTKEDNPEGKEKLERYVLSQKLLCKSVVDLTQEDIAKIKHSVGKYAPTATVGQIFLCLEKPLPEVVDG